MNKKWSNSLSDEQVDIIKDAATMGRPAFERLIVLCDNAIEGAMTDMTRERIFELDWPRKQAALVGEVKTWKKVKELVINLLTSRQ